MFDKPHEYCGLMGVYNNEEASKLVYLGLYSLQHRGQESAGICSSNKGFLNIYKYKGLVADVFNETNLAKLIGNTALGHVRYSTTGSSRVINAQPLLANYRNGSLSVAHNGNITNAAILKKELENRGAIFQTTTDSEILIHLIAQSLSQDFFEALYSALIRLKGSYSLLLIKDDKLIALKDPRGFRPLCVGTLKNSGYVIASESCAFDIIGAQYLREVQPGEIIIMEDGKIRSEKPFGRVEESFCIFEYIYFSRPDSMVNGKCVYDYRHALGEQLAHEHPVKADVVIAVPDSSNPAALGFSKVSGIPFDFGLIRSHYTGRTFIEPEQHIRDFGAKVKYNPVRSVLRDKRVVVVDDSIVRGTTSKKIVKMLRNAGAKEVHFRVSAPQWVSPCYYGIDTPNEEELIGSSHNVEEIKNEIDADSLGYLSLSGLHKVMPKTVSYCTACFSADYPGGKPVYCEKNALEINNSIIIE